VCESLIPLFSGIFQIKKSVYSEPLFAKQKGYESLIPLLGTITGDELHGSFTDGNNATITITGKRTL